MTATEPNGDFRSVDEVLLLKRPGEDSTWMTLDNLPTRRHAMLTVVVDKTIYAFGGITDQGGEGTVHQDILVLRLGQDDKADRAPSGWQHWGTLPGSLVGMEAVLFSAGDVNTGRRYK
ncbi:uncharacterized protein LOC115330542 [Ixodes scapularis]|uniref:uncharacterized protein LOC115330542 n=1 Tax=Ixodes scapularis TaxID=6945 RepID=UPI001A9F8B43|nr:uncharacterized protein LOC115330542 [Ixodes scapularis]